MKIYLIRHGMTPGNALRKYIGRTDEPLSPEGATAAAEIGTSEKVKSVYVTPLLRTQQTAKILFPHAAQIVLNDLREMDFGVFENRSAAEMEQDEAYRAWVDGRCLGQCPQGESTTEFNDRVAACFEKEILHLLENGEKRAVFVVHGGTVMAVLGRFLRPKLDYFAGIVRNCEGYALETAQAEDGLPFTLINRRPITRVPDED